MAHAVSKGRLAGINPLLGQQPALPQPELLTMLVARRPVEEAQ